MKNIKLFLLILGLFGCGTDTGNPTLTNGLPVSSISTVSDQISYVMCSKIRNCFTPALTDCETKIKSALHITNSLGISEITYPNLNVMQTSVDSGNLRVELSKESLCFQYLSNATCSDALVQQSYSSTDLENLNQAWKLLTIHSSCNQFIY